MRSVGPCCSVQYMHMVNTILMMAYSMPLQLNEFAHPTPDDSIARTHTLTKTNTHMDTHTHTHKHTRTCTYTTY